MDGGWWTVGGGIPVITRTDLNFSLNLTFAKTNPGDCTVHWMVIINVPDNNKYK